MKKEIWLVIILGVIIVVLVGAFLFGQNQAPKEKLIAPTPTTSPLTSLDISVLTPKVNEEVSSPIKITGVVSGNGWAGFEGQVGTVKLLDSNGNELAQGILTATTEWTTLPTSFETNLNFTVANSGPATLVFKNENASGDPAKDKTFTLPVKLK